MANPSSPFTAASYSDSLLRLAQANVSLMIGWADAASQSYKAFYDSLDENNIARMDIDNGLIQGTMKAFSKGWELMPKVVERSFETFSGKTTHGTTRPSAAAPRKAKSKPARKPA
jgi:hypothetical protein